ncbi:hypothetical protein C8Q74DRAFT_1287495 [Fomes fomentarius]|nr:hypothetical protein C8Q74DRAFT_1287495 [Fomes fomentarius]
MVSKTVADLGGLDVMVANAGIVRFGSITEHSVEDWDCVLSVNARGPFLCVKHAARQMVAQGRGGRIICASSDAGKNGFPNTAAYSASKFAVRGLMHSAALELRPHKITVNAYCPGLILTPLAMHPDDEACGGPGRKNMQMMGLPFEPVGPSHVSDLVSYLAKSETSYVTGQSYSVDGGLVLS